MSSRLIKSQLSRQLRLKRFSTTNSATHSSGPAWSSHFRIENQNQGSGKRLSISAHPHVSSDFIFLIKNNLFCCGSKHQPGAYLPGFTSRLPDCSGGQGPAGSAVGGPTFLALVSSGVLSVNRRRCPQGRWEAPGTSASPQTGSEHRNRVRNTVLFPFRFPLPLSPKSHCGKPPLLSFRAQPAEGKGRRARFPKLLLGGKPGASREAGVISPLYVGRDAGGGSPAEVPVSRRWGWDLNPQGQGLKGGSAPPHAHSSAPTPKF